MHTRLRSRPGLAMAHGWHAGQALACIGGSAARTFWCKVPMLSLLTLKNGQAYSLQQVNCLFV